MTKKNAVKFGAIGLVGLIVLLAVLKSAGVIGKGDEIKVTIEKAEPRTIVETVSANGKVQPEVEVKMSADVSGELVDLFVKEGDIVTKGTLLAKINPEIYKSNLDRMVASVNSSRANLESARSRQSQSESRFQKSELDFNRNEKLYKDKVISTSEFETIKSSYEVSKGDVDAAIQNVRAAEFGVSSSIASLNEANENLNKTSIFAPVNGTVSKLSVEQGERVVGTLQMAGTEIMRIANLNEMEVSVDVSENDIVRVHMNDTAVIDIDAYRDQEFKGIVTEIANSANTLGAQSTDQVTNFVVKIRILRASYKDLIPQDNPHASPFRPGMSATVDIQTKRARDVISVPIQAVTTRDTTLKASSKTIRGRSGRNTEKEETTATEEENITECIFLHKSNGTVEMKVVTSGIQDNSFIEVLSGIEEGDEVVTGPFQAISKKLKDGDQVRVVEKEKLFSQEGK